MARLASLALLAALAWWPAAEGAACGADHVDARARVSYVFDGDTIKLADARHVRFIGINAPEIAHDGKPAQPFGVRAAAQLRGLLRRHHHRVELRYDVQRRDHYGRTLAHIFLDDGTNVEQWLLQRGLATTLAVPPNLWNIDCYRQAERRARAARRGIWALPRYQPVEAQRLPRGTRGYRLVRGRVAHVGTTGRSVWLDLAGGMALRIARPDLHYFPPGNWTMLKGKMVLARGWVHWYHGRPQMRIRHPAALQIEN
ncbi:MAG: thermonuclease family protein [Gammaproteobacteria bacterium]